MQIEGAVNCCLVADLHEDDDVRSEVVDVDVVLEAAYLDVVDGLVQQALRGLNRRKQNKSPREILYKIKSRYNCIGMREIAERKSWFFFFFVFRMYLSFSAGGPHLGDAEGEELGEARDEAR